MITLILASVSFVSLVVSLLAFRRYANGLGWLMMAIFVATITAAGVTIWQSY